MEPNLIIRVFFFYPGNVKEESHLKEIVGICWANQHPPYEHHL
jgi:hypothetical protein